MTISQTQFQQKMKPSQLSVYISGSHNQTCTLADTWYTLDATQIPDRVVEFTSNGSHGFIFNGLDGSNLIWHGSANVESDGAATISIGLFRKPTGGSWTEQSKFVIALPLTASDPTASFSSRGTILADENDEYDVRIKSSVAGIQVTLANMTGLLWLLETGV